MVIFFFAISLNILFNFWKRTQKIKFWRVCLLALLPGFGISFIAPIYQGDYGDQSLKESRTLDIIGLSTATNGQFELKNEHQVVAFFTSDCPHCKAVAHKLAINIAAGQEIPVYAMFPDNKEGSDAFITQISGQEFNDFNLPDSVFLKNAGNVFPATFLIDKKGNTVKAWSGDVVNYNALDEFLDLQP
jgi:thiol-disulfide isomerase/thioredoxin